MPTSVVWIPGVWISFGTPSAALTNPGTTRGATAVPSWTNHLGPRAREMFQRVQAGFPDLQALQRRCEAKARDSGVDRLVLLVAESFVRDRRRVHA